MPKNTKETPEERSEREAWVEFERDKGPRRARKLIDPAEARRNAQAAADTVRAAMPDLAPQTAPAVNVGAANGTIAATDAPLAAPTEAPTPTHIVCVRCKCVLGGDVRGVSVGDTWYCPKDFMMGVIDVSLYPYARAVKCPTCLRESVDFTGRNMCSVCHARGAAPLRVA